MHILQQFRIIPTMTELFQKAVRTINEHIQNIFEEGELQPDSLIRKFRITAQDGKIHEQNKIHFAATGMTVAEIVRRRADAGQANMSLPYWTGGRALKHIEILAAEKLRPGGELFPG